MLQVVQTKIVIKTWCAESRELRGKGGRRSARLRRWLHSCAHGVTGRSRPRSRLRAGRSCPRPTAAVVGQRHPVEPLRLEPFENLLCVLAHLPWFARSQNHVMGSMSRPRNSSLVLAAKLILLERISATADHTDPAGLGIRGPM